MHHHPYSRAVEERTHVNRAVDDAHAWLVDHAQGIEDEQGIVIPVDFYQLKRMRQVVAKYGDYRARAFGDGSPESTDAWSAYFEPTDIERRMMRQYQKLMALYANRDVEESDANSFGSWAMIVAVLVPWVLFAIGYVIWRWQH